MTERLYYADSLLFEFDAKVTSVQKIDGKTLVSLSRSAFYPTSGGQPYDTGTITDENGRAVQVTDVNVDADGEVWHTVSDAVTEGAKVHGCIDKARRLDHMEQHGGEHLLAGAIWRLLQGVTIGLHTGHEDATIDVTLPDGRVHLTEAEIALLEQDVNDHIRQNVPVRCYFPEAEELEKLPLRKAPTVQEHVRIVQFGDFEYCACGGTHPPFSGMIGMLKILSVLPARGKARVRFVCGNRAVKAFGQSYRAAETAGAMLSCGAEEIPDAIEKLQGKLQEKEREKAELAGMLARYAAENAQKQAVTLPDGRQCVQLRLPFADRKALTQCAGMLIEKQGTIALCLCPGEKNGFSVVFARAADAPGDMGALMRLCGIRGGGKPDFAQGSADTESVLQKALACLQNPA